MCNVYCHLYLIKALEILKLRFGFTKTNKAKMTFRCDPNDPNDINEINVINEIKFFTTTHYIMYHVPHN